MPIVTVLGIHNPALNLDKLNEQIKRTVSEVEELSITEEQVSVFFLKNMNGIPHGEEVIVKIEGLFERPERTSAVRKTLADRVGKTIESFSRQYLDRCQLIEVFVYEFNPASGFTSIEITPEDKKAQSD